MTELTGDAPVAAARPPDAAGPPGPGGAALPAGAASPSSWPAPRPGGPTHRGSCSASRSRSPSACCATSPPASGSPHGRVELRRGLLNRHVLSTPVDRVRTVDLTASPIHRLLGLTTVRVGTGTASTDEDDRLDLDGLPAEPRPAAARGAAAGLARRRRARGRRPGASACVVRLDPGWIRFAPFTSSGAGDRRRRASAPRSQLLDSLGGVPRLDPGRVADGVAGTSPWVAVPAGLGPARGAGRAAVDRRLPRHQLGLHAQPRRRRLAPAPRAADHPGDQPRRRAGQRGQPSASRSASGWPAAPGSPPSSPGWTAASRAARCWCRRRPARSRGRSAREVLGTAGPVDVPLVGHGPRARTRRFTRALVPALAVLAAAGVLVAVADASYWLLAVALPGAARRRRARRRPGARRWATR